MNARALTAIALMVLATTVPVLAQGNGNGNGNSGDNGNSGNNGNGNNDNNSNGGRSDSSGGNGNSEGRGNGNGNGNGNNAGNDGNDGIKNPHADTPSSPSNQPAIVPEGELLPMVEAGQTVSLGSLLPDLEARTGGQIIDAQLVRLEHTLVYAVKVLTPGGRVGVEYYNARSGQHIEAP